MKSYQLSDVEHPQVVFECGQHKIETEIMKNIKKNPNFLKSSLFFDIVSINSKCFLIILIYFKNDFESSKMLPIEEVYIPPISINVIDHRNFGRRPIG